INEPVDSVIQNQHSDVSSSSCDGSLIVFHSAATNLTENHSGSGSHVYLADIRNGLHITDITPGTTENSGAPQISCNGRYITYNTKDRTLINPRPTGMNSYALLVRYDRLTGERIYVDSSSNNTTFNGYQGDYIPSSVSDMVDVVLGYSSNTS